MASLLRYSQCDWISFYDSPYVDTFWPETRHHQHRACPTTASSQRTALKWMIMMMIMMINETGICRTSKYKSIHIPRRNTTRQRTLRTNQIDAIL